MSDPARRPLAGSAVTRRSLLLGGAAAVGASAFGSALTLPGAGAAPLTDPFTLGVASGDPLPDGVVLWTRLAPNPTADDGTGGAPRKAVPVQWEIAEDPNFRDVVQRGRTQAAPEFGHSVHVEVRGLRPGAEYFYRFKTGSEVSPAGRTRTAPAPGSMEALTMCFCSCANYGPGYFTAYRRMAEDHPDLMLHLGDYMYEVGPKPGDVRHVLGAETKTLADYRRKYAQYKTDADLQAAHATAPWLVVFDDHEVANNWADETPQKPEPNFPERRAAAFQAYYENMPLRRSSLPRDGRMQLFRRYQWGALANFHMLDTRQYRDDQACGDGTKVVGCTERFDPARSLTGEAQEQWLVDGLARSGARWDVLGQQVFFSKIDLLAGPAEGHNTDSWDGYVANRDRIATAMGSTARNPVVLTGDVHEHWAAEIKRTHDDPESRPVGTEFVTTSISSDGDGHPGADEAALRENPHVKFNASRRGYVRTRFGRDQLRVDYRTLEHVSRPGAEATTAKTFVVEDRNPRLHPD